MKKLITLFISFYIFKANAANWYVSQNGAGTQDGASLANAATLSWLNTSANWGNTAGNIAAGDTIILNGTITNIVTFYNSGNSGSPITLKFASGASMSFATLPNTASWVNLNNQNWIVVDGANVGSISCTDNGTLVGVGAGTHHYANGVDGINASGSSHVVIQNLHIGPLYDRQDYIDSSNMLNQPGTGIYLAGSDYTISNCFIEGGANGMVLVYSYPPSSNLVVWGSTFTNFNHGITVGSGGVSNAAFYNINISSNYIMEGDTFQTPDWGFSFTNGSSGYVSQITTPSTWITNSINSISNIVSANGNYYISLVLNTNVYPPSDTNTWALLSGVDFGLHRDLLFVFGQAPYNDIVTNVVVANNVFQGGGSYPLSSTAGSGVMFQDECTIYYWYDFNNLIITKSPLSWSGGGGFFGANGDHVISVNNTAVYAATNGTYAGGQGAHTGGSDSYFFNNIIIASGGPWLIQTIDTNQSNIFAGLATNTIYMDYNIYNHQGANSFIFLTFHPDGSLVNESIYDTFTAFNAIRSPSLEPHSTTSLVQLDNKYVPLSNDTIAIEHGTNLTTLAATYNLPGLLVDINGNPRPTNSDNWTIGAFQVSPAIVINPTRLRVRNHN